MRDYVLLSHCGLILDELYLYFLMIGIHCNMYPIGCECVISSEEILVSTALYCIFNELRRLIIDDPCKEELVSDQLPFMFFKLMMKWT